MVQKFSRINALAVPILLFGSEIWTLRKQDKKRLAMIEVKFVRRTAGTPFSATKRMKKFGKIWKKNQLTRN
jgi:hypothetical protein